MPPLLEAIDITKQFPGTLALDKVRLELLPGEIHAVVGENGAGKSTLMKILSGVYTADAGEIRLNDHPVSPANPRWSLGDLVCEIIASLRRNRFCDAVWDSRFGANPRPISSSSNRASPRTVDC